MSRFGKITFSHSATHRSNFGDKFGVLGKPSNVWEGLLEGARAQTLRRHGGC